MQPGMNRVAAWDAKGCRRRTGCRRGGDGPRAQGVAQLAVAARRRVGTALVRVRVRVRVRVS